MRIILSAFFLLMLLESNAQNVKSPDQFLGYQLGEKYTHHYKIVQYFEEVARSATDKMKLEQYGKTYEGRELLLAIVSSPENMMKIDEIRKNNLRMTGLLNDQPARTNMPAVVWLSYNVHGNEASSSEVSMKILYELVSGNNKSLNAWLKNTVVIIDPCLNPDGRDRYVNWYQQMVGKKPIPNIDAREHDEPWPGGRSNHYNFDLNRDWAWQTQMESAQRIKIYNRWMPVIHCDFHEQFHESPYYFAPAAEPFHEVITPWQKNFQIAIGKNHAKYFDIHGWLYFTKEYFDLFYPSYGDTYPIYNGSIGMTYEQAGHSMSGLAVEANQDTLTLADRIAHHYTTSVSTIEMAADSAFRINEEFKKYFDGLRANGSGEYKSYLLIGLNENKLRSLKELFEKNDIGYAYAKPGVAVKGLHYFTGKPEGYVTGAGDLVISTRQPKGTLARVLFEPESKLADSSTYDITAWSLPFAYGIDCYMVKEQLPLQNGNPTKPNGKIVKSEYAYLITYRSFDDGKMLSALLNNNVRVRFAEKDFSFKGTQFKKGTLVILGKGNENNLDKVLEIAQKFQAEVTPVTSGFMDSGFDFGSDKFHFIKKPVVALLTGESVSSTAAGEIWHLFDQELDYPIMLLNAGNTPYFDLKKIDVLIVPDGNYKFLSEKDNALKAWVRQGGRLIALENAVTQMAFGDWGIKIKSAEGTGAEETKINFNNLKKYGDRERQSLVNSTPGAIYKVQLDETHPICFGYPDSYYTLKMNSNLLEFSKEGWNVGAVGNDDPIAGFVGSEAKKLIKNGAVILNQRLGNGSIVCFTDNPVFRSFWQNGKLLLFNAVFLNQ